MDKKVCNNCKYEETYSEVDIKNEELKGTPFNFNVCSDLIITKETNPLTTEKLECLIIKIDNPFNCDGNCPNHKPKKG